MRHSPPTAGGMTADRRTNDEAVDSDRRRTPSASTCALQHCNTGPGSRPNTAASPPADANEKALRWGAGAREAAGLEALLRAPTAHDDDSLLPAGAHRDAIMLAR